MAIVRGVPNFRIFTVTHKVPKMNKNCVGPDEVAYNKPPHLGLHFLPQ